MKQFGTILKFELKNYFSNKIFTGVTIFFVAIIAIVMFFPRVTSLIESNKSDENPSDNSASRPVMLIASGAYEIPEAVTKAFADSFMDYDVQTGIDDIDGIKGQITDGNAECAFVFDSLTSYTYYVGNLSMYDGNIERADAVLTDIYRTGTMIEHGISAETAKEILSTPIEHFLINNTKRLVRD